MFYFNPLVSRDPKSGNFGDVAQTMLPLATDFDNCGERRWQGMSGLRIPRRPARGGIDFTVRIGRLSD